MAENLKITPAANSGQTAVGQGSAQSINKQKPEENLSDNPIQNSEKDSAQQTRDLMALSMRMDPQNLTVEQAHQIDAKLSKKSLRNNILGILTWLGAGLSTLTGFFNLGFGDSESRLGKALNGITDKISKLSFGGFGVFGLADAIGRRDLAQAVPQAVEVIMPWIVDPMKLTNRRGVPVGGATIAAELARLNGRGNTYENFSDSMQSLKESVGKYVSEVSKDPMSIFTGVNSGVAGISAGIVTTLSPLLDMIGFEKGSAILRQVFGVALEVMSKLNPDNILKGRDQLVASGTLMTGSSVFNLLQPFVPEQYRKGIENLTQVLNLPGKRTQLNAYNNGELGMHDKKEFKLSEMPGRLIKAILFNGEDHNLEHIGNAMMAKAKGMLSPEMQDKVTNGVNAINGYVNARASSGSSSGSSSNASRSFNKSPSGGTDKTQEKTASSFDIEAFYRTPEGRIANKNPRDYPGLIQTLSLQRRAGSKPDSKSFKKAVEQTSAMKYRKVVRERPVMGQVTTLVQANIGNDSSQKNASPRHSSGESQRKTELSDRVVEVSQRDTSASSKAASKDIAPSSSDSGSRFVNTDRKRA